MVVPSPSWPSLFSPNVHTVPLLFSTTVWLCPVSTATLLVPSEVTWVGVSVLAVVPPTLLTLDVAPPGPDGAVGLQRDHVLASAVEVDDAARAR